MKRTLAVLMFVTLYLIIPEVGLAKSGSPSVSQPVPSAKKAAPSVTQAHIDLYKYYNLPIESSISDLCLRALKDPKAPSAIWLEAAHHILTNDLANSQILREMHDPSISDLLSKHAFELLHKPDPHLASDGVDLALALAAWDGAHRRADLARFTKEIIDWPASGGINRSINDNSYDRDHHPWALAAAYLCQARIECSDSSAIKDYSLMIGRITPQGAISPDVFCVLWKNSSVPEVQRLCNSLFNRDSIWSLKGCEKSIFPIEDFWKSNLLTVPAFRTQLIELLKSNDSLGTITVARDGLVRADSKFSGMGYNMLAQKDVVVWLDSIQEYGSEDEETILADEPTVKQKTVAPAKYVYRVRDAVALTLSQLPGFPEMQLHWSLDRKDAATEECIAVLNRYGSCLRAGAKPGPLSRPFFAFPRLSQPATAADVAQARAIFSISEPGEKRLMDLKLPQKGKILGKPDSPFSDRVKIWQAEEVVTANGVKRYFGIVGKHRIGQIDASKVKLGGPI